MTKEEYLGLLNDPVFKWYQSFLEKLVQIEMEDWSNGQYAYASIDESVQKNSEAIGRVALLKSLLSEDLTYEKIMGTLHD